MNASDNRFYREPAIAADGAADRELAEAIYNELRTDDALDHAVATWYAQPALQVRARLALVLDAVTASALDRVLARRQREAARTGPWDGGHHFQEEDGYPGSLLPPKRGET